METNGRRRRATVKDVAIEAGVSRGTVSRVLNGQPYVSDEARAAIDAAIAKVGFVPNRAARSLVMQSSQAIGLIVHEPHSLFVEDPNIGSILLGANAALSEADYQLSFMIADGTRDIERLARYLSGGLIDGVIIVSARVGDPITRAIAELGLPAAFVGHPRDIGDAAYVAIDNRGAAREITARLAATGRSRIGMIASALDRDSGSDRLAGFVDALGNRFDPQLVERVPLYSYSDGQAGMRALLERAPDIDGVFASSDAVAAGAMDVLQSAGRVVPRDVGVVGFDDSSWALRCDPPLSTVHQPANELGRAAAESVLRQLRGEDPGTGGSVLSCPVVWRESA
ncbi:LacI family DNA-binding transcriptional regulator [Microbacterium sp. M3]|uniref:LacI family DNA-binding transcriptional regulator n=1 Tax=Microbacterium arthrosphaerae TaxID=792652 RepID=A0ABU4GZW6_9MICO|nr:MULTISPECIES: LacI family DNA-binding transcriptional regulator [Microbacterium]MDW4571994.1 LacI family DNA-binding transcriptional regulator [Microbacterium arthrosphaerae]MDW7605849.1 LacI family DNA-binding transcriptional regulator [Microbacterium sp. M3]